MTDSITLINFRYSLSSFLMRKCDMRCTRGWLHDLKLGGRSGETTAYIFPSPFHRWFVEKKLCDSIHATQPGSDCLLQLAIAVGSPQGSSENEESVPDAFSHNRTPSIKTNSTVAVTHFGTDRSQPSLNSGQRLDESIFTYPLSNGVWNFCVKVIGLSSTPVGFQDRGHMEMISCCLTLLY